MLRWFALASLLLLPGTQACLQEQEVGAQAGAELSLDFPKAAGCSREDPTACPAIPEADFPIVLEGTFEWAWMLDACAATVPSPTPVVVTFQEIERSTKGWLAVTTEPREIIIPVTDQWDLRDDDIDPAAGTHRGREVYPITVTISLVGEPSEEALRRIAGSGGSIDVMMKASTSATSTFNAGFAVEAFLLDGRPALELADADSRGAPMPPVGLGLVAVGLAAMLRRRA